MFRKLSIKSLALVFLVLLAITISFKILDNSKGIDTLKPELFNVDAESVTSVVMQPKMLNGKQIELKKDNDQWIVMYQGKSYNGDANTIESLIKQVNGLKPLRLAAQDKDRWESFELTDSLASEVNLLGAKGHLATLFVGKFTYRQPKQNAMMQQNPYMRPQGTMTTYVRSGKDKAVYAVEGFLGSLVNRDVQGFRDKTILETEKTNIKKIVFEYPADSSFTIVNNENTWMANGIALDSASVVDYLTDIASLKGSAFTNENLSSVTHKAKVQLQNGITIEVSANQQNEHVYITSTQNRGTIFKDEGGKIFDKLFASRLKLVK